PAPVHDDRAKVTLAPGSVITDHRVDTTRIEHLGADGNHFTYTSRSQGHVCDLRGSHVRRDLNLPHRAGGKSKRVPRLEANAVCSGVGVSMARDFRRRPRGVPHAIVLPIPPN